MYYTKPNRLLRVKTTVKKTVTLALHLLTLNNDKTRQTT